MLRSQIFCPTLRPKYPQVIVASCLFALVCLSATIGRGDETSFYKPVVIDVEGWAVRLDPQLLEEEQAEAKQAAVGALANHLQRIKYIVLPERVAELQRLPLWLELHNASLESMQYHPSRHWLRENGHDPALERHVHIPHAADLTAAHMWAKHPYVILHELAHAYHDQVLSWEHPEIIGAYDAGKSAGIYEQVLSHTGEQVRHYGLSNPMEYFAEATEAYFGVNDFYPFVRAELKEHDPRMFSVLEKIWGEIR
jgi:hypothetical protein